MPDAQHLSPQQSERNAKLEEASNMVDTELLTLPQREELILEDGTLDIRTTYYEGGTMVTIPNVETETVKDYRTKFGLESNVGGLPGIEKNPNRPTPMATASTTIPLSTTVSEDPYGGVASAEPSSSSAAEPRETVGEAEGEWKAFKKGIVVRLRNQMNLF